MGSSGLSGPLPTELGLLRNLQELLLENNDLTGDIPSELFAMTRLGTIPSAERRTTEAKQSCSHFVMHYVIL